MYKIAPVQSTFQPFSPGQIPQLRPNTGGHEAKVSPSLVQRETPPRNGGGLVAADVPLGDRDLTTIGETSSPPPTVPPKVPALPLNDLKAKNVVVFGETGVGKSSVINMIMGGTEPARDREAPVSNAAVGCTFSSRDYQVDIDGEKFVLWDTAGLNEGMRGSVTHPESIANLAKLLENLGGKIHLLVYCIRGKRFRQVIKDNYDLFFKKFCQSRVPIVLVVTGLECEEPDMENWWKDNKDELMKYGLKFDGHACITASRGKASKDGGHLFDEEYEDSQEKVRKLIKDFRSETGCSVYSKLEEEVETPSSYLSSDGHPSSVRANSFEAPPMDLSTASDVNNFFHHANETLRYAQRVAQSWLASSVVSPQPRSETQAYPNGAMSGTHDLRRGNYGLGRSGMDNLRTAPATRNSGLFGGLFSSSSSSSQRAPYR